MGTRLPGVLRVKRVDVKGRDILKAEDLIHEITETEPAVVFLNGRIVARVSKKEKRCDRRQR